VRRGDKLSNFTCRISWNLGVSTFWKPQGLSRPVMGLLYLLTMLGYCEIIHTSLSSNSTEWCTLVNSVINIQLHNKKCRILRLLSDCQLMKDCAPWSEVIMIISWLPEGNTVNQPFYSSTNYVQCNQHGVSFSWKFVFLLQEIMGKNLWRVIYFKCLDNWYEISKLYITIRQLITHWRA